MLHNLAVVSDAAASAPLHCVTRPPRRILLRSASKPKVPHMLIREATSQDKAALLLVQKLAFGQDEEAILVEALLSDPSAQPVLSLLAEDNETVVDAYAEHHARRSLAARSSRTRAKAARAA